jgi:hypothetical protein
MSSDLAAIRITNGAREGQGRIAQHRPSQPDGTILTFTMARIEIDENIPGGAIAFVLKLTANRNGVPRSLRIEIDAKRVQIVRMGKIENAEGPQVFLVMSFGLFDPVGRALCQFLSDNGQIERASCHHHGRNRDRQIDPFTSCQRRHANLEIVLCETP